MKEATIIPTPAEERELMAWLGERLPADMAGEVQRMARESIAADRNAVRVVGIFDARRASRTTEGGCSA